jgi:acetyltransferase
MTDDRGGDPGTSVVVRPIRFDDEAMWLRFLGGLSWATRYKRGARRVDQLTADAVKRAVRPRPGAELAFVAVVTRGAESDIVGVSRGTFRDGETCEFTLVVADAWQGCGVGARLMRALMDEAGRQGHGRIVARVLATNGNMLDFVRALGFAIEDLPDAPQEKRVVCIHRVSDAGTGTTRGQR